MQLSQSQAPWLRRTSSYLTVGKNGTPLRKYQEAYLRLLGNPWKVGIQLKYSLEKCLNRCALRTAAFTWSSLANTDPQTLQTLASNFCHHKKAGKIASFSPFWPSQSWKMTLGGTPLSTSIRKKPWRRYQVQISQFFHQGLEQRPLGWIPQLG